jgi:proliferating cell nuclear antigen
MFKIVIPDSKVWKNLMSAISALVEEATFDITSEGLKLRAMDPSHVALVDFQYPRTAFQEYVCSEPSKLCIDIGDLLKLMRRVESGEQIELSLDPEKNKLAMKLIGRYTRRFSLPLLQPSTSEHPTPKLTFDAKITLDGDCLNDAVADISTVSEQVKFEAYPEKLILRGGGERGDAVVEFEKNNEAITEFQVNTQADTKSIPYKALYDINFLSETIKAGTATSKLSTIEFSTDKPIKIHFTLPSEGVLTYYLAPRTE